jgi:hypothetical protein
MNSYRELHPIKEGKRKWRYGAIFIELELHGTAASHPDCLLYVGKTFVGEIRKGKLYIHHPYVWNGSTPKRYIGWPPFGMWIGTPDFKATILASGGHDILFQFSALLKFDMEEVNYCFWKWIDDAGAENIADIYHAAVDQFGGKFWAKADPSLKVIYT